jgi:hypothetical protein
MSSGHETNATNGFQKKSKNGIFLLLLYSHFATSHAALFAFLFHPEPTGFTTI